MGASSIVTSSIAHFVFKNTSNAMPERPSVLVDIILVDSDELAVGLLDLQEVPQVFLGDERKCSLLLVFLGMPLYIPATTGSTAVTFTCFRMPV